MRTFTAEDSLERRDHHTASFGQKRDFVLVNMRNGCKKTAVSPALLLSVSNKAQPIDQHFLILKFKIKIKKTKVKVSVDGLTKFSGFIKVSCDFTRV